MSDLVATWQVALADRVHEVRFEHGTTTGRRVILVDNQEVLKKPWMFRLVGRESFNVGSKKATIHIEAVSGFQYEYTLEVDGKSLKKFVENRKKTAKVWTLLLDGEETRIVLEKDTMEVWVNGSVVETAGEFVDDGTETHFSLGRHNCCVKAVTTGKKRDGILHCLLIDDNEIPETSE
ncbi:fas apoptotic inhibitory molecule 1-like [Actinia tenebrosa]|uniref:Fas apoptotic inhibitory molecule 1-like n=1 Tax=Actinia tenebrosa TaxID=6105 RepID=A0A6P8HIP4_ACTTE|nr:fas apoptotic inhibitory molecule 1-like [Actinia tenebrosa]